MKLNNRRAVSPLLLVLLTAGIGRSQELGEKLLSEFPVPKTGVFVRDGNRLTVNVQPPPPVPLVTLRGISLSQTVAQFALGGDFEYIVNYEVIQLGKEGQKIPSEVNVEISVDGRGHHGITGINVNSHPEVASCYRVIRVNPKRGGTHFNMITVPRASTVGRIGMRRQGSEIIYLAADGPDAALVELVRYPYNPLVAPNPRVSVYQGNSADGQPINVVFSNFIIKADRLLRGAEAFSATPPAVPRSKYALHLDYSKTPDRILADFPRNNDKSGVFTVDAGGLRVVPVTQAAYSKEAQGYWFRDSRFALEGDFEVSLKYKINKASLNGPEGYGSVSVNIGFETETPIGSISFGRGMSRDTGQRYGLTRYSPSKAGHKYDTQSIKANAMHGRLVIQRVGSEMIFSAQEGDDPRLLEISRLPYIPGPIAKLRISTDMGGNVKNVLDATLSDLVVKSGKLVDPDNGASLVTAPGVDPATGDSQPVVLDSVPQARSRKWLMLGVGGAILGVLLLGGVGLLVWRGRSATTDEE